MAKKASKPRSADAQRNNRLRYQKAQDQQKDERLFIETQYVNDQLTMTWVGLRGIEIDIQIWDGADLFQLRDAITDLFENQKHTNIGIDMKFVLRPAEGFCGMLTLLGTRNRANFRLRNVDEVVQKATWFKLYCRPCSIVTGAWLFDPDQADLQIKLQELDQ